jgi:hypothetical protein
MNQADVNYSFPMTFLFMPEVLNLRFPDRHFGLKNGIDSHSRLDQQQALAMDKRRMTFSALIFSWRSVPRADAVPVDAISRRKP